MVHRVRSLAMATTAACTLAATSHASALALVTGGAGAWNCAGEVTWSFSSPLTPAFTPSGTVTQSRSTASVCGGGGASYSSQVTLPLPDSEWTDVRGGAGSWTAAYAGSCVVASVGIGEFGVPGDTGLLVGGMVMVSSFSDAPGGELDEVDALATTSPCNELSATGGGDDLAADVSTR